MTQFNPEVALKKLLTPCLLNLTETISNVTRMDSSATEITPDDCLTEDVLRQIDDLLPSERKQVMQLAISWLELPYSKDEDTNG
ncbi:MAG TPA: hypothetical protein VK203_27545 [Nostocaceae cyanobacterium]|nr:hypothetical protein [Nostocaceae cyanobacterium]